MPKTVVQLRSAILVFLTHNLALPLLRILRGEEKLPYSREALHGMPAGSLGKELITMLDGKNLELLPYYARHDIKHILLRYDTTDEGEVCLQCFMLGNGHVSFPVVATIIFGAITMPEYWGSFRRALRRGHRSARIADWQFTSLLHEPTAALIHQINHGVV